MTYLFCRETPLQSACLSTLVGTAAEFIGLAVLIESWHPRCEDTDCLFGTARLRHMQCDACWCLSQEQSTGNASNVHVFCCYVAKLGNGHDHLRAAVVIRGQLRGFVWRLCTRVQRGRRVQVISVWHLSVSCTARRCSSGPVRCKDSCSEELFLQCPELKTRRLTDNHGMRFASRAFAQCLAVSRPPERETLTGASTHSTVALTKQDRYPSITFP